jgi:hypothetical protein
LYKEYYIKYGASAPTQLVVAYHEEKTPGGDPMPRSSQASVTSVTRLGTDGHNARSIKPREDKERSKSTRTRTRTRARSRKDAVFAVENMVTWRGTVRRQGLMEPAKATGGCVAMELQELPTTRREDSQQFKWMGKHKFTR